MRTSAIRRVVVFGLAVIGVVVVAICTGETDEPTEPLETVANGPAELTEQVADDPLLAARTFQAEQRIIDVAVAPDGRLICFMDNHGNVSLMDTTEGEVLWTRNITLEGAPSLYENEATWGQCEFVDATGRIVAGYLPNFNWISVLPADGDEPVEGFWAGRWGEDDILRLYRALCRRRTDAGETVREPKMRGDLVVRQGRWLNWTHADARKRIHQNREVARALCESESLGLDGTPLGLGVATVRGQTGILTDIADSAPWPGEVLAIFSADDHVLSWWFEFGRRGRVLADTEDLVSLREEIHKQRGTAYRGTFHKYVDSTGLDPQTRNEGIEAPPSARAGTSQSGGQSYVYFGGTAKTIGGRTASHIEGCGWACVGKIDEEGQIDWRAFMTAGMRNFAVDGYEILALYPNGRIAVWSMAQEGGGQPELLAEGQAIGTRNITQTAAAFQDGAGVVSIESQYWLVRNGQVEGPYEAEGEITSIALSPPYWVYGTADGAVAFGQLGVRQPIPPGN